MDYAHISVQERDGIFVLTLNRPNSLNALNMDALAEMRSALDYIKKKDDLHGLIFTGLGEKAFCAGADLKNFQEMDPQDYLEFIDVSFDVYERIWNMPVPTAAALNGLALGGGCELALACDFRLAVKEAVLGLPEINHGLLPGWGGILFMLRMLGRAKTLELVLTGKTITAEQALEMGLITQITSRETLLSEAELLISTIAKKGLQAVKWAKRVINDYQTADLRKAFIHEALSVLACFVSDEAQKKVEKFSLKSKKE